MNLDMMIFVQVRISGETMINYFVQEIPKTETTSWLLHKHYLRRIPSILYAFGLYNKGKALQGVCTFGPPCRMMNDGYGIFGDRLKVNTLELNRLVVNEGLDKNTLSFFVGQCINSLPKPICLVSYADKNKSHHGYIYQATNWIYTGLTSKRKKFVGIDGKDIPERTISQKFGSSSKDTDFREVQVFEQLGKYRYLKFLGDKRIVRKMRKLLTYNVVKYPKGKNKRYEVKYMPHTQMIF